MAYTADLLFDRDLGFPIPRETRNGWRGVRHYRVNTEDAVAAVLDAPIPQMGEEWSSRLPRLVVVDREPRWYRGRDAGTDPPTGGHTLVKVEYEEIGLGGTLPPLIPGQKFTELASSTDNVQVMYDADLNPTPLANGDGASQVIGRTTARVSVDYPLNTSIDLSRLIVLGNRKNVNDAPLVIPPILGTTSGFTMAAGQVRYEGFATQTSGNLFRLTHELSLADDYLFRWRKEDGNSHATGPVIASRLYTPASLAGLW